MAEFDVYVDVASKDAAGRIAVRSHLLRQTFDDVANDFDDVVTAADALLTAINVCTWDHIEYHDIRVREIGAGLSANIAANNQVVAFTRIKDVTDVKGSFEIVAWDDGAFSQDTNNLLSPAYNTAAAAVALLTRNPETGENWALLPDYSQSRTRKSGIKLD